VIAYADYWNITITQNHIHEHVHVSYQNDEHKKQQL